MSIKPIISSRRAVAVLWLCFVLRAVFYCAALPLWEGYDEYSHFAFIDFLIRQHRIPARGDLVSAEIAQSLRSNPLPRALKERTPGAMSYDEYWMTQRRTPQPGPPIAIYEAQQPPLYYLVMAGLALPAQHWPLEMRVLWLRIWTALLASMVIPLGFAAARRVFGSIAGGDVLAIGLVAVLASMPELLIDSARVSNEGLAIAMGSGLILLCVRWRGSWALGAALGAMLLTKAYGLAFLPPVLLILLVRFRGESWKRVLREMVIVLAISGLIAGWWYAGTWASTGSMTGEQIDAAAGSAGLWHNLTLVSWWKVADLIAVTYTWLGAWSFLEVRSWMYHVMEAAYGFATMGIALQCWRRRPGLPSREALVAPVSLLACLVAGLAYQAIRSFAVYGKGITLGYYLYCLAPAEGILLVAGLARCLPERCSRWVAPVLSGAYLLLGGFGLVFLALPYYAGITRHDAAGALPALHLAQLRSAADLLRGALPGVPLPVLYGLGALDMVAALSVLGIALAIGFRAGGKPDPSRARYNPEYAIPPHVSRPPELPRS